MTRYVALLRAVNVGTANRLRMADIVKSCRETGFAHAQSVIASGNLLLDCDFQEGEARARLESALEALAGRPIGVILRSPEALRAVLAANPFPNEAPDKICALFLNDAPPEDALTRAAGRAREELRLGAREIYVFYPDGIGRSKLKIPGAENGTARNVNTIARLLRLCE
jgi:uncharacterized protein (DUF1697 family)